MKRTRNDEEGAQSVPQIVHGLLETLELDLAGVTQYEEIGRWAEEAPTDAQVRATTGINYLHPLPHGLDASGNMWNYVAVKCLHWGCCFEMVENSELKEKLSAAIAYQAFLARPYAFHFIQHAWKYVLPPLEAVRAIRELMPVSIFRDFCSQMEFVFSKNLILGRYRIEQEAILATGGIPLTILEDSMSLIESPAGIRSVLRFLQFCRLELSVRQRLWTDLVEKARRLLVDLSPIVTIMSPYEIMRSGITELTPFLDLCNSRALDYQLSWLVLSEYQISDDVIHMTKILLKAGASPLQRDGCNSLLITNVRAGLYYPRVRQRYFHRSKPGEKVEAVAMKFGAGKQLELIDILANAGTNWSPKSHHQFPQSFRKTVFTLLCCNFRQKHSEKSIYLPRDPMGLVIANLARQMYISEEQQCADTVSLLSLSYSNWLDRDLLKEAEKHRLFAVWCAEKWNVNPSKRNYAKSITREMLIELLVHIEMWV